MLPFKLVYHEGYDLNIGPHVFPTGKYRQVHAVLLRDKLAEPADFLTPEPASDEDVLRVHSKEYVYKLMAGRLSPSELMRLEIPYSPRTVEAFWLAAGGTILAGQREIGRAHV